jgi:hypothetical protein
MEQEKTVVAGTVQQVALSGHIAPQYSLEDYETVQDLMMITVAGTVLSHQLLNPVIPQPAVNQRIGVT